MTATGRARDVTLRAATPPKSAFSHEVAPTNEAAVDRGGQERTGGSFGRRRGLAPSWSRLLSPSAGPAVPPRPRGTEGPARLLGGRGNEGPRRRSASASPRPLSFPTSVPDPRRLPAEERPRSKEQKGSAAARVRPGPGGASSQRAAEAPPPPSHPLPAAAAPCRSPSLATEQEPRSERRRGPSERRGPGMARGEAARPPEAGLEGPRRR